MTPYKIFDGWKEKSFRWFVYGMIIMGLIWILDSWLHGEEDSIYWDDPASVVCPESMERECAYG